MRGERARLFDPKPVSQPWLDGAIGTARWTGTPLAPLLEEAGMRPGAVAVAFAGLDHGLEGGEEQDYERGLSLDEALRPELLLATEMNDAPLPPQHGFPLRLVVPGWYGMTSVKWLARIRVLDAPFDGYQNRVGYQWRPAEDAPSVPVETIQVRSLMAPPGYPAFLPRERHIAPGRSRSRAGPGRAKTTSPTSR